LQLNELLQAEHYKAEMAKTFLDFQILFLLQIWKKIFKISCKERSVRSDVMDIAGLKITTKQGRPWNGFFLARARASFKKEFFTSKKIFEKSSIYFFEEL
jgi:hypothetical protein